jgi:hypothetical protein
VTHAYGPDSKYARQPIYRHIRTTGVALWLPGVDLSLAFANALADVARRQLGIHPQDLGVGAFHYQGRTPWGAEGKLSGVCIFDSTHGSLRLSGLVLDHMEALLIELERHEDEALRRAAASLAVWWSEARAWQPGLIAAPSAAPTPGRELVAPGSTALLLDGADMHEVLVQRVRFHPSGGLVYVLQSPPEQPGRWEVGIQRIQPIPGVTMLDAYDPDTDDWAGEPRAA